MPKRIVILDPNGVEVNRPFSPHPALRPREAWESAAHDACGELQRLLQASENPKLGTYTVTVEEVWDD